MMDTRYPIGSVIGNSESAPETLRSPHAGIGRDFADPSGPIGAACALAAGCALLSWIGPVATGGHAETAALLAISFLLLAVMFFAQRGRVRRVATLVSFLIGTAAIVWLAIGTWFVVHDVPEFIASATVGMCSMLGYRSIDLGNGVVSVLHPTGWIDFSVSMEKLGHMSILVMGLWIIFSCSVRAGTPLRRLAYLSCGFGILFVGSVARLVVLSIIDINLDWVGIYWMPWIEFTSVLPIAILIGLAASVILPNQDRSSEKRNARAGRWWSIALVGVLAILAGLAEHFDPPGAPAAGRVLIDEGHSDWAWAVGDFDQGSFGERKVYTYNSLRRLLEHFWTVDIRQEPVLDAASLRDVDVLMLKMPTRPYEDRELDAIEAFVRTGGGLWLVGDHTNLFGSSTHLNRLAMRFGIEFHKDSQFDLRSGQPTRILASPLSRSLIWSTAMAPLERLTFLTSCTIQAPAGRGELLGMRMGSEPGQYSHINFFGNIKPDRDENWGVFCQQATVNYGRGRVTAFADSTVFSDFCLWDDSKATLALHTINRLNRDRSLVQTTLVIWLQNYVALLLVASAVGLAWQAGRCVAVGPVVLLCVAGATFAGATLSQTPLPQPRKPLPHVRIIEELSGAVFPSFLQWDPATVNSPNAFDQFALCWNRIGYAPVRDSDFPTGAAPAVEVIILPMPDRITQRVAIELSHRLRSGKRLMILADSAAPRQRLALSRLLHACGISHRMVSITTPRMPVASGVSPNPLQTGERAGRIEIEERTWGMALNASGLWVQVASVGSGEIIVVDGATALSRRCAGMTFKQPNELEVALAEFTMALQREAAMREPVMYGKPLSPGLVPYAQRVENLWSSSTVTSESQGQESK